ncbi:unnamed protein product, partial [marine sediment metagenome]
MPGVKGGFFSIGATGSIGKGKKSKMGKAVPAAPPPPPQEITIGGDPDDHPMDWGGGSTLITDGPADGTGKITKVAFYAKSTTYNPYFGIFYRTGPNLYTCRDWVQIMGTYFRKEVHDVDVDLDVVEGDYLGMYWRYNEGEVGKASAPPQWYKSGNQMGCVDAEFSPPWPGTGISLAGSG